MNRASFGPIEPPPDALAWVAPTPADVAPIRAAITQHRDALNARESLRLAPPTR